RNDLWAVMIASPGSLAAPNAAAAMDVRTYLCWSRRSPNGQAQTDYAYSNYTQSGGAVLGSKKPVNLGALTSQRGTSNTMLLSHRSVPWDLDPPPADSWAVGLSSRDGDSFIYDDPGSATGM